MELKAATGNRASQRTALKAGLQREGIMRNAGFIHTGRVDLVLFSRQTTSSRSLITTRDARIPQTTNK